MSRKLAPRAPYKPVDPERVNTGVMGTIYLIHFDKPLAHARHYLGWTSNLTQRIEHHQLGYGGKLMNAVTIAGIDWSVVRTWSGDRNLERRIKNNGSLLRCCPTCTVRPRFATIANPA